MEKPGKNLLRDLHENLDRVVMAAYGFCESTDLPDQLLTLNHEVAGREKRNEPVQSSGLPVWFTDREKLVSDDCIKFVP